MINQEELEPSFQAIEEQLGVRFDALGKDIIVQLINLFESETTRQWRREHKVVLSFYYATAIRLLPIFAQEVAETVTDRNTLTYQDIAGWVRSNKGYIHRQIIACFPGVEPGENPFNSF